MIRAEFVRRAGAIAGFRVHGHADTGPYGEDLVCAAASAIVQTALLGMRQIARVSGPGRVREGDVTWQGQSDAAGQAIIGTMLLGLQDLAAEHPEAVSVRVKEEL